MEARPHRATSQIHVNTQGRYLSVSNTSTVLQETLLLSTLSHQEFNIKMGQNHTCYRVPLITTRIMNHMHLQSVNLLKVYREIESPETGDERSPHFPAHATIIIIYQLDENLLLLDPLPS